MRLSCCEAVYLIDHLPMRSNYVQTLVSSYFIRLNSSQFQLKLPARAELGKNMVWESAKSFLNLNFFLANSNIIFERKNFHPRVSLVFGHSVRTNLVKLGGKFDARDL